MKLRVLIIPIILMLVFTFMVSCSESSPEDIISQYSNYFENEEFDKMYDLLSKKSKGNQTKEEFVENTGSDPSDDETTKLIISQMMDSFKFEPIESVIDGNEAYVETRITTPDFGQLFAELFSELFALAFSSEDLEKESNDLIVEYLKNNKLETVKVYRDIRLVYEDGWKIDTNSFELFEVPEINSEEIEELENNEEKIDQEEVSQESKISDYDDSTEASNTESTETPVPNKFDEDNITKDLEVTEYQWSNNRYSYVALVVKNHSEFDLAPSIKMVFYDGDNNMIGVSNQDDKAFESGYEMAFVFINEDEFTSYKYDISVQEETRYDCVLSDLSVETNITDEKAILSVTNDGDKVAKFVKYNILYFNGNEVVGRGRGYCVDDDNELKPGKTEYAEDNCYETFDSIKVYFSGRR